MMKKQGYIKYMRSKAMTLYILAALLVSFPHMAIAMALPFNATANGTSTYLDSSGGTVTLNVLVEQTDGPNGVVILTASSQGVSEFSSQNYEKRCFLTIDGPFPEDMQPMPQAGGGASPMPQPGPMPPGMPVRSETLLSYHPERQALTGTFSVNAPGSYMIRVDFGDGQTGADTPARVNFRLQDKEVEVTNGVEATHSLAELLGWDGLNLTVQSVRISDTSSGVAQITPTVSGNTVNSLRIKGTKAGELKADVNVICNGQPNVAHITVQITGSPWPPPIPPVAPLGILLAALLTLFLALIYANFIKRIPGAFVINCECGATKFHNIDMKAPHGRSMTLYQLLNEMLKQRTGDHDADIIRGIMNDSDNKRTLKQVRIYIVKGEDRRPHYAFSKAGNPETVLDDTMKTVYPDSGNRNSKLTVTLSFIAQWSGIKRG